MSRPEPIITARSPLHPIFVHFTIALTSASFIFDILAACGIEVLRDIGWWLLAGSVVSTCATLASGIWTRLGILVPENQSRRFLRVHMVLGPSLFGCLIALAVWRALIWQAGQFVEGWYFAGMFIVFGLLFTQAYIGGELVYRFGMDVRGSYRDLGDLTE